MELLTDQELTTTLKEMRVEEDGTFRALFAPFEKWDKAGDWTERGAFGHQKVVISAYGHGSTIDGRLPVGKGEIFDGPEGGIVAGKFFLNTTAGRETYETVKELGDLQEWSYYLPHVESETGVRQGRKGRILKKIEVKEVCPVLRGAANGSHTISVKEGIDLPKESTEAIVNRLADEYSEKAMKSAYGASLRTFARNGGAFKDVGDFVVKCIDHPEELKAMGIISGEAGGFLVPTTLGTRLFQIDPMQAYIRARALVIPAGDTPDSEIDIPAARQGTNPNVFSFTAANEGTAGTAADPRLDLLTLAPQRFSAYITVGNALLRNSALFSAWFEPAFRAAKAAVEEYYFLQGAGGAQPLGMLYSPGRINVSRGTASTIVYGDVVNMMAKAYGLANCIWIASQTTLGQIMQMKDSIDTDDNGQFTLAGIPLFWSSRVPTLGTAGDLMFINPALYTIKDGSGPFIAQSPYTGSNFVNDQTTIKCGFFMDAQPAVKGTLTLEDGTVVSPVVVLN